MKIEIFFENRGKSETGGKMHHGLKGGWTPLYTIYNLCIFVNNKLLS